MAIHATVAPRVRRPLLVVLAVLATLAASVTVSEPAGAATSTELSISHSVYAMLNAERAANHLPALGWSGNLINSAHRHNLAMASANVLSHQLPGEAVFSTRISQAGVAWHSAAENIGWTTDRTTRGASGLESAMYGEKPPNDGHRLNILSRSLHDIGIDVLIDAHTGKLWLTEDFADVPGTPALPPAAAAHNPFGGLDSATVLPGHQVRLVGWAVDPDDRARPLIIAIIYDGHGLGHFRAAVARPDIAKARAAGPDQGYSITVTLPAGVHTINTYAMNIGMGNDNPHLGSKTVRT